MVPEVFAAAFQHLHGMCLTLELQGVSACCLTCASACLHRAALAATAKLRMKRWKRHLVRHATGGGRVGVQGGAVAKVANVINLYFEGNWCPLQARPTFLLLLPC